MHKITKITKQKRTQDRYNIYIDDAFAGALNAEAMVLHHIKENIEINPDEFQRMVKEDNQKYAFNLAVKQVAARRRTEQEVRTYLIKKELSNDIIDYAVAKVLEYGYINDLDYAKEFVSYHINAGRYGRVVLSHKMQEKGFSERVIESALEAFTPELEFENAKVWYEKYMKKYSDIEPFKQREKIYRGMAGKGFSYDIISSLLSGEDM